jgi:hypothetical protein
MKFEMAVNPNHHQESVLADSPEEQRVIANLTAQRWKLYACPDDVGKPGYVRLIFTKLDPTFVAASGLPLDLRTVVDLTKPALMRRRRDHGPRRSVERNART